MKKHTIQTTKGKSTKRSFQQLKTTKTTCISLFPWLYPLQPYTEVLTAVPWRCCSSQSVPVVMECASITLYFDFAPCAFFLVCLSTTVNKCVFCCFMLDVMQLLIASVRGLYQVYYLFRCKWYERDGIPHTARCRSLAYVCLHYCGTRVILFPSTETLFVAWLVTTHTGLIIIMLINKKWFWARSDAWNKVYGNVTRSQC